jgi:superfamily I DNA/RNA helicase
MANILKLSVAGSGKTEGLVKYCASSSAKKKITILTFTQNNQMELRSRLRQRAGDKLNLDVFGWYTFLLRNFAYPFIPFMFNGMRVKGFNFEGRPSRYAKGLRRFFDSNDCVFSSELGRLSYELIERSEGALQSRLECLFDEILIDEVQDLSAYDFDILEVLLNSKINIRMVGDVRQAVLSTNPRGTKHKKFKNAGAIEWFRENEKNGLIEITEELTTWRCCQEIADFSDSIFPEAYGFGSTKSKNKSKTLHDGVFKVSSQNAKQYIKEFSPQCLRDSKNSGKNLDIDFMNFKVSKGQTFQRVLILPTENIKKFITEGKELERSAASKLYVAVTRAEQSVAFILDDELICDLKTWTPD